MLVMFRLEPVVLHDDNVVIFSCLGGIDSGLILQEETVITNSCLADTNTNPTLQVDEVIINNFLANIDKDVEVQTTKPSNTVNMVQIFEMKSEDRDIHQIDILSLFRA